MQKVNREKKGKKKNSEISDSSTVDSSDSLSDNEKLIKETLEIQELDLELEQLIKLSEILLNLFNNNKKIDQTSNTPITLENDLLLKILEEDDLDNIDYNKYKLTKLNTQPSTLKHKLNPYQLEGVNWMLNLYETGFNGILADEMGLGKTIQSIALICYLKEFRKKSKFLIVAPKSVIPNWLKEFQTWTGDFLEVVFLNAVKGEREEILEKSVKPKKFDVVLTTYEGRNYLI
jgi:SNF2 family DNA or RNA helicase